MNLLDQGSIINQVKALEEAMVNNTGAEPSLSCMWWELDKLKAALLVDFDSWLRVVKYHAMINGESHSDLAHYDSQKTWREYFNDGFTPEEAIKTEKSYA